MTRTRLPITLLGVGLLMTLSGLNVQAQVAEEDSLALVALYNATNGPDWVDNTNWLTRPVSQWNGVTVTGDRVTSLRLIGNRLTGSIPVELGSLTNLEILFLNNNDLTGSIPMELGTLANLSFLLLEANDLTGAIPVELGTLANLTRLRLSSNHLTGSIPVELASLANLFVLTLNDNDLTGSIPVELGNLVNLVDLFLHDNDLTGSIPMELGNLASLKDLRLSSNRLAGSILPQLGNLINLEWLFLGDNRFTGSIPPELGNLTNLKDLRLSNNQFTGSIPPELGSLVQLGRLDFNNNPLSGTLPSSLINLSRLNTFWFDETNLCEPIDEAFQAWLHGIANVRSTGCTNVATEEVAEIPAAFALDQNYPNPFNPSTTIRYALPQPTAVRLSVYDVQGRRVALLVEAEQAAGWHEVTFEAGVLPSGVYFYRLESGAFQAMRQMFLLR